MVEGRWPRRKCGCGFGQMPQTDEEMVEFEMRRTDEDMRRSEFSRQFAIEHMRDGTWIDKHGCHRWKANDNFPPDEVLADAGISRAERRRCGMLRMRQQAEQMRQYRKARAGRPRDPEEMYEMRAAFGPGETVVDVITGERIKLPGRKRR